MPSSAGTEPSTAGREEGTAFVPKFDSNGLLAAIVVDSSDNAVLMFAYMNEQALNATIDSGFVHLWSRSRQALWKKGETSGETLRVVSIRTDCDQDAVLIHAEPQGRGATCHTGRRSCFYRTLSGGKLEQSDTERLFDPKDVYGG